MLRGVRGDAHFGVSRSEVGLRLQRRWVRSEISMESVFLVVLKLR